MKSMSATNVSKVLVSQEIHIGHTEPKGLAGSLFVYYGLTATSKQVSGRLCCDVNSKPT